MKKTVQFFGDEYLERCRKMKPGQIVEFVEGFRELHSRSEKSAKSRPISIKIPEDLLEQFRRQAALLGIPYQTQIKKLMRAWLVGP